MSKEKGKTVFVGISGGVDSSVAALLLKQEGYTVVGAFIKTWQPDFITCTWREERRDAMRVCAALDIPFITVDLEEVYKESVAMYMVEAYRKGLTPNPDVMCNREIKFGAFWEYAKSHGADYIATGHYAQNPYDEEHQCYTLSRGIDTEKDQSYFLWTLTQDDLEHTLFPVGAHQKNKVREMAEEATLPTAEKKDSQGVCFLGEIDMKEFLSHYIRKQEGVVLSTDGERIGYHSGAHQFTLGERHGFTIEKKGVADAPKYVVAKDITKNTITVSEHPNQESAYARDQLTLQETSWVCETPTADAQYTVQIRYHGEMIPCTVSEVTAGTAVISLSAPVHAAAPGQSAVLYAGGRCIGGGVIV